MKAGSQETCVIDSAGTLDKPLYYAWARFSPLKRREAQETGQPPSGKGHPGHRVSSAHAKHRRKIGLGMGGPEADKGWLGNEAVASRCPLTPFTDSRKSPGSRIPDQEPGGLNFGPDSSSLCDLWQVTVNSRGLHELNWTERTMVSLPLMCETHEHRDPCVCV